MFESKKNQGEFVGQFLDMIKDQIEYASQKYKADEKGRDTNDLLCEEFGTNWLLGTMKKYVLRTKNVNREKDAFKIATDLYVLYLKRGFYVCAGGINDPILYSNVDIKSANFDAFADRVKESHKNFMKSKTLSKYNSSDYLDALASFFVDWSKLDFNKIPEDEILRGFILIMQYWIVSFDKKCVDKDTWNETAGLKKSF